MNSELTKKIGAVFVSLIIVVSLAIPKPAEAVTFVDFLNLAKNTITSAKTFIIAANSVKDTLKEFVLDPAAWVTSNLAIQGIVNSTLKHVLTANNGAPSPVTDLQKHFLDVGDVVATGFLQQLATNGSIKSPFQAKIAASVQQDYFSKTGSGAFFASNPYTLDKGGSCKNATGFLGGDFSQGGFSCFFAASQNTANNPFGAAGIAKDALLRQVATAQTNEKDLLQQGNGFLPIRTGCTKSSTNGTISLSIANVCLGSITTPGHILSEAVNKVLGSSQDKLIQADEFDEILANFVSSKLFGSGGLLNLNKPDSTTGRTALDEAAASQKAVGDSTAGGSASAFIEVVTGERDSITAYVADVTKINSAANSALSACSSANGSSDELNQINDALATYSSTKINAANSAIASFNQIIASANAASQENDLTKLEAAQQQYTALQAQLTDSKNPNAITPDAISAANSDASDTPESPSLYNVLVQLAQTRCK